MFYKTTIPTSLAVIVLPALLFIHTLNAQTISDTVKRANDYGDEGYWQSGQPDIMILWPEDDRNIVRRFSGSTQHPYPYRLWVDPDRAGGFPVLLKDEPAFNNFLEHIKANPEKDWCQIAETWSAWTGNPPSGCGVRSYTQQSACTVTGDAEKPCPNLCVPAVRSRTGQVDNGPCEPVSPPPSRVPSPPTSVCSVSAWKPSAGTVCIGDSFSQSRTLADCSIENRTAIGTKSCASYCAATAWAPPASTVLSGETFTQTRTLADCSTESRTAIGTKPPVPSCAATAWAPPANTVLSGETFTQTRTLADCSTESRTAIGTKPPVPSCAATAWAPPANTVLSGETFTQTRTLADCSTESRTAIGTKPPVLSCAATAWAPPADTICAGKTFTQTRTLTNCNADSRMTTGTKFCLTCGPPMHQLGNRCCAQWVNGNSIGCYSLD